MRQIPLQRQEIVDRERVATLQRWVLVAFGLIAVIGFVYIPLEGLGVLPAPAGDTVAAMDLEAALTAAFFPQVDSISGQYLLPFLSRLVVTGAAVLWLLRSYFCSKS